MRQPHPVLLSNQSAAGLGGPTGGGAAQQPEDKEVPRCTAPVINRIKADHHGDIRSFTAAVTTVTTVTLPTGYPVLVRRLH